MAKEKRSTIHIGPTGIPSNTHHIELIYSSDHDFKKVLEFSSLIDFLQ